jgi:hypothetical protein
VAVRDWGVDAEEGVGVVGGQALDPVVARERLTSSGRIAMPNWRASSRMSRRGYMPGSWVSRPGDELGQRWAFSHAER